MVVVMPSSSYPSYSSLMAGGGSATRIACAHLLRIPATDDHRKRDWYTRHMNVTRNIDRVDLVFPFPGDLFPRRGRHLLTPN